MRLTRGLRRRPVYTAPTLGNPVMGTIAYSAASGATVAPVYPNGIVAGDGLLLIVGQKPSAANVNGLPTISGWTMRGATTGAGGYGTTLGADTGNTNLAIYSKDTVLGTETGSLSVSVSSNNVAWAVFVRVPKTGGAALNIVGSAGSDVTTGTAVAANTSAAIETGIGDEVFVWAMCIPTDVTTPSQFASHTIAQAGVTFSVAAELGEADSGTGNDIGGYIAWARRTSGSATAVISMGAAASGTTTNVRGPLALVRVRNSE